MAKTQRTVPWDDVLEWEKLLTPGVVVVWNGANGKDYRTTLLKYGGGNARLRFHATEERGEYESEPCYVENFVGIETDTEIITITKRR